LNIYIVSGASSPVADFLLPKLLNAGGKVYALSRTPETQAQRYNDSVEWCNLTLLPDMILKAGYKTESITYIHLAPTTLLQEFVSKLRTVGINRIIAFSSTSRFTKVKSSSPKEIKLVTSLENMESWLERYSFDNNIKWTVFRPTMIYGNNRDRNITTLRRIIKKFPFFIIAGSGRGKRQPVHAMDLAQACLEVELNSKAYNKAYNLSGAEVLSFKEMLQALADKDGHKLRLLRFPGMLFKTGIRVLRIIPKYRFLTPAMVDRTEQDLVFSFHEASKDFGYSPCDFRHNIPDFLD